MPRVADPNKLKFYFEPQFVPENILTEYTTWQHVCVPVPVPLIRYLTPIMRIWQSPGCLKGTPDEIALFLKIWTDLVAEVNIAGTCEDGFMLRQNPANSCQLQQSIDGGTSWTLAFDYSLCKSQAELSILNLTVSNLFNQWNQTTNNTEINQFAPELTFTSSTGESVDRIAARKLALCQACKLYVYGYCEMIRKRNADGTSLADVGLLATAAIAALAVAVEFASLGATTPLFIAAGAALGLAGTAAYSALTNTVLDDIAAKDTVACFMYNSIKDEPVSADNFKQSVSDDFLSGNAELIRYALALDIANTTGLNNQYNAFINLLGDLLRPAELGLIDDCFCDNSLVLARPDPSQNPPGQDSGFDVENGTDYIIMAEGAWTGGYSSFDANGWAGHSQFDLIMPSGTTFALIARIGDTGAWFHVGTELTFTASATGRLYFAMNDAIGAYTDNSGALTVSITPA